MDADALFTSWPAILRVVVTCVLAYVAVVALVRISGKRTLAQLNAFDWIVTVAFGSMLATTVLSDEVALLDGVAAFVTLATLQFVVTWGSTRVRRMQRLVKNEPALLVHRGELLADALRRERISEDEIFQALRASGAASLDDVGAVVLETNGEVSVLRRAEAGPRGSLGHLAETKGETPGA